MSYHSSTDYILLRIIIIYNGIYYQKSGNIYLKKHNTTNCYKNSERMFGKGEVLVKYMMLKRL